MSILDTLTDESANSGRVYGVAAAVVTNNKDPDDLYRVKLKFPWLSDSNETDWIRIATLMAGGQRGSFFLPEVGDEVLVGFENGDINRPYVIGSLWNGKDKSPGSNSDGKNNIRKITSRSGHEIIFDDNAEQKKEKVEIKTNAGHTILLDDASGKEKVNIKTKAGHNVTMDDTAGKEKIEIIDKSGSNKIVIDTMKNSISIESGLQLKIKSNIVEIEGSSSLTIKSGGVVTVQGSMVKIN
ncbi:MAG: phage baseplate assembly protein V [Candidatus Aminicenantes bacterium]|nr:phage baseplate assembly protein V [Candidatus Aminicenantes bacterium]